MSALYTYDTLQSTSHYRRPRASSSNRSSTFDRALRELAKHARAPTTHDPTRYGLTPSSPPNIHRRTTTIDHDPAPRSHLSIDTSVCNRSPGRRDHAVLLAAPFTSYHFVYMCRVISNTRCTRVLGGPQLPTRTRGGGSPKSRPGTMRVVFHSSSSSSLDRD